jgi:hypothetical protein
MVGFNPNAGYYIKAGELRALLSVLPPDTLIVMSKDSEGNDYSPLSTVEKGFFFPETSYSGEVGGIYTARTGGIPALILWPTN